MKIVVIVYSDHPVTMAFGDKAAVVHMPVTFSQVFAITALVMLGFDKKQAEANYHEGSYKGQ